MKILYYCPVCGRCGSLNQVTDKTDLKCNYCNNIMEKKGEFDWESMDENQKNDFKNQWKQAAILNGKLSEKLFQDRINNAEAKNIIKEDQNYGNRSSWTTIFKVILWINFVGTIFLGGYIGYNFNHVLLGLLAGFISGITTTSVFMIFIEMAENIISIKNILTNK